MSIISTEINKALAGRVRSSLLLPSPMLPPQPPLPEDTSEESLRNFQAARIVPTRDELATQELRARRAAARRTLEAERLTTIVDVGNIGTPLGATDVLSGRSGPVPFDFQIISVYLTVSDNAAAGSFDVTGWNAVVSKSDTESLEVLRSGALLFQGITQAADGIALGLIGSQGQNIVPYFFEPRTETFEAGSFIHFVRSVNANVSINPTFVVQSGIPLAVPTAIFRPPLGRVSININTAPPRTRSRRAPVPRAAVISTSQGGRILSQRTVAWQSLTPAIRADWFNRQVGGDADPNIRWIP